MPQTGATAPNGVLNLGGNSTGINIPGFSAFGSGQINIPGATPGTTNSSNPYGGSAYANADTNILGQMTSAFGEGAGDSLFNFMMSGAGYNPAIAQQLLGIFQPQIATGQANLASEFGAAGMGNSSSAGIAQGAFQAEMANNEDNILAQQYEQGTQNYMNMLMGISGVGGGGTNIGNNQTTTMGTINQILGGVSGIAGGIEASGAADGTAGTIATILQILAGM